LTPFILSTWAILTGSTQFKKANIIKACSSTILLTTGFILIGVSKDLYLPIIDAALIEIGVLFIISRLFFFKRRFRTYNRTFRETITTSKKFNRCRFSIQLFLQFFITNSKRFKF